MKKRLFALLLALCMTLSLLPIGASAAEIVASGKCGKNVVWQLDANGLLTVSGTGKMEAITDAPWASMDGDNSNFRMKILSAEIKSGVTAIGNKAFYGFFRMASVSLPNTVTSIGEYAFYNCPALTTIKIPDSVKMIGESAFFFCEGLKSVTLPAGLKSIGNDVFRDCTSLKSVTIPDSVTSIGDRAFGDCSSLTSVKIPSGVTSIGESAFSECSALTSVTLPAGITTIREGTFISCGSLKHVTIPDGVTSIGDSAFMYCASLTSITIPESVTNIEDCAFIGCSSLTSVTIPKSVKRIGDRAFSGSGLTSITIPANVEGIVTSAFCACKSLQRIEVSPNNTHFSSVDGCLFNKDLTHLWCVPGGTKGIYHVPEGVEAICGYAFAGCSGLTEVVIPESVKYIEDCAFIDCSGLMSVTLPDGVESIPGMTFAGCRSLTSINIPDSVTFIGESAFGGCAGLTSVTIPGSVEYIGECAFAECSGLVRAAIGTGLNAVGSDVFSGCKRLRDVLFAGKKTDWRFERDGEWEDGTTALGLSNRVRIHYNVSDPENHIRLKPGSSLTDPQYECDCGYDFSGLDTPTQESGIPSVLPADYGIISEDGTRYGFMHLLWTIAGSPKPTSTDNPYTDVTQAMAPAVLWATEEGITSGTSHTSFSPDSPCTRGQIVTFLWRFAGKPETTKEVPFTDAEPGAYWYKALLWAYGSGTVAFEESQTLFEPNQQVKSVSFDPQTTVFRLYSDTSQMPEETPAISFGGMVDDHGNLTITNCYVPSSIPMPETLVVPETVRGDKVVALDSHAFEDLGTLKTLYLPLSLREVFDSAFPPSLKTIYYEGCSEAQWNRIVFHSVDLSGITIHYRAHSWDAGTLDADGVRHYTCTSCGETKTAVEKKADTGVKVLAEPAQAAALKNVTLVAEKNTDETKAASNVVVKSVSGAEKTQAYDIRLEDEQGKTVQPKSSVTVVIPLPKDWDPNEIAVYYVDPKTGKTENMKAVASSDGKTVSFQTTHFSCYVLTQIKTTKQTAKNPFKDVKSGAYYYDPVLWAVNHDPQITNGTGKDTFSPEGTCTRAQVVTFLWRAAGCPEPTSTKNPFKDVSKDAYYYKAVLWAVEKGITNGTGKDTFSPNAGCTRGQVVTFQYRTNGSPKVEATNPFKDVSKGQYYYDAVLWAVKNEITKGTDTTHFSPNSTCTRGQIVTFLYRDMA